MAYRKPLVGRQTPICGRLQLPWSRSLRSTFLRHHQLHGISVPTPARSMMTPTNLAISPPPLLAPEVIATLPTSRYMLARALFLTLPRCTRLQGTCRGYRYRPGGSAVSLVLRARHHRYRTLLGRPRHMLSRDECQIRPPGTPLPLAALPHPIAAPLPTIARLQHRPAKALEDLRCRKS